jgi:hypothetical protein
MAERGIHLGVFIDVFSLSGAMEPGAPCTPFQRAAGLPSTAFVANGTINLGADAPDHGEGRSWTFL